MNYEQREHANRIMEAADRRVWVSFTRQSALYPKTFYHFKVSVGAGSDTPDGNELLNWLLSLYINGNMQLDGKTCEQLCDDLYVHIASKVPNKDVTIEASENGDIGYSISYNLTKPSLSIVI